jgi:hypothetical protein
MTAGVCFQSDFLAEFGGCDRSTEEINSQGDDQRHRCHSRAHDDKRNRGFHITIIAGRASRLIRAAPYRMRFVFTFGNSDILSSTAKEFL